MVGALAACPLVAPWPFLLKPGVIGVAGVGASPSPAFSAAGVAAVLLLPLLLLLLLLAAFWFFLLAARYSIFVSPDSVVVSIGGC